MSADEPDPTAQDPDTPRYRRPDGGWGAVGGMLRAFGKEDASLSTIGALERLNKPGGVMCSSCAWAKPKKHGILQICENGAKAVFSELTTDRCEPELFDEHTLAELRTWSDMDLDHLGRLTHPLRYDAQHDRYAPCGWDEAFEGIGQVLRALPPEQAVFYASGHAGLEPSYLYALFARVYGHNNLPQSSNMCHETTSVGLSKVIGSPVGTCTLEDFEHCDAIFVFGQNPGTNAPRFLEPLQEAAKRGCRIVTFNPVREKGLLEFVNPQNFAQMTVAPATKISDLYLQVRPGGDIAVLAGMIKEVLAAEDAAPGTVLDQAFIDAHTNGFDAMAAAVRAMDWATIEHHSGLDRALITRAARIYLEADAVIGVYGMGLTQHVHGFQNLAMLTNLLLLRGNLGRLGAGITPVRGHSNVQGQRTVGIAENPDIVPLDDLETQFDFRAPRTPGRNVVATGEGVLDGSVRAVISLGGNLLRAMPDRERLEAAWGGLELTVSIATKLNRTHLVPGKTAYLLPCLGRLEEDVQATGPQAVSIEDTFSHIHGSLGRARPASRFLRSELAIVAGMAKATLEPSDKLTWDAWTADYATVREQIERTYPDDFRDFNARLFDRGGFYRGNRARERIWLTSSGRAEFTAPTVVSSLGSTEADGQLTLITLRSHDQFNTTIYGLKDRLRKLKGNRNILLVNRHELARLGLEEGQVVTAVSTWDDDQDRRVPGLVLTAFDLPNGCAAGYFPELNPLIPLGYHDLTSQTPAYKGAPIRIEA